jgi:predicted ArsR family transcriptional regulator
MSTANRTWTPDIYERLEILHCVMGMDLDDIARELGKTPVAVRKQIDVLGLRLTPQAVQARRARGLRSQRWSTPANREYPNMGRK